MFDQMIGQSNWYFTWYFGGSVLLAIGLALWFAFTLDKAEYEDEKRREGHE